jgi:class 3 adenylate cyclase
LADIEGSTQLWETHPEAMQTAQAPHDDTVRRAVEDASAFCRGCRAKLQGS